MYILQAQAPCSNQMCSVKLRYNGTVLKRVQGCLAFDLQIRGQPGFLSTNIRLFLF